MVWKHASPTVFYRKYIKGTYSSIFNVMIFTIVKRRLKSTLELRELGTNNIASENKESKDMVGHGF